MKTLKLKPNVQLPRKPVTLEGMNLYSLCRWASLKEAIDIVGDKCEEKQINFDNFDLKPLDLLKYVDSMTDELYTKVAHQEHQL
jgi:hypothetical protein